MICLEQFKSEITHSDILDIFKSGIFNKIFSVYTHLLLNTYAV